MKKYFLLFTSISIGMLMFFLHSKINFTYWEVEIKDYLMILIIPIFLSLIIALFIYTKKFYWERLLPALIISYFLMFGFLSYQFIDKCKS